MAGPIRLLQTHSSFSYNCTDLMGSLILMESFISPEEVNRFIREKRGEVLPFRDPLIPLPKADRRRLGRCAPEEHQEKKNLKEMLMLF